MFCPNDGDLTKHLNQTSLSCSYTKFIIINQHVASHFVGSTDISTDGAQNCHGTDGNGQPPGLHHRFDTGHAAAGPNSIPFKRRIPGVPALWKSQEHRS